MRSNCETNYKPNHEPNHRDTETQRSLSQGILLMTLCLCVSVVRFTGASQGAATGAPAMAEMQNATFAGFGQPKGAITFLDTRSGEEAGG